MQNKISRLKTILLIGTIILFLAGSSFLFVKNVDSIVKTLTMLFIGGVFGVLSVYEEKVLKFKGTSTTTHVFACLSAFASFYSVGIYEYFGSWFSLDGEGALIFLALLMFIISLLLLISMVRYKVYKLLELCLWFVIVGLALIIVYYKVDVRYVIASLLILTLLKNLINMNGYSKWYTLFLCLTGVFSYTSENIIITIIVGILVIANSLLILYKDDKVQILAIILLFASLVTLSYIFEHNILFIILCSLLDICISYTHVLTRKDDKALSKIFINVSYIILGVIGHTTVLNFIYPFIILGTSLFNIYVSKDGGEEYILPFKVLYFTAIELYYVPIEIMKEYLIVFITNMVMLFMYFISKKRSIKNICLALLGLINVFIVLRVSRAVFPNVVYLVLFALDFYIIYVTEEKGKIPLSILFIIYSICLIGAKLRYLDPSFALGVASLYAVYLCITRKNKAIFIASLIGFIVSSLIYLNSIISNGTLLLIIANIFVILGIMVTNKMCIKDQTNRVEFTGVFYGLQTYVNLLVLPDITFKIFALVESIGIILISIKYDKYKSLYYEGLVGVIISLLFTINTISSLPKSLYLIVIGLTIVATIPFILKRYLDKQEELKKIDEENRKKLEKETKKKTKTTKIKFCPECGNKVDGRIKFCGECGYKIK